jgi:hypothetical protein
LSLLSLCPSCHIVSYVTMLELSFRQFCHLVIAVAMSSRQGRCLINSITRQDCPSLSTAHVAVSFYYKGGQRENTSENRGSETSLDHVDHCGLVFHLARRRIIYLLASSLRIQLISSNPLLHPNPIFFFSCLKWRFLGIIIFGRGYVVYLIRISTTYIQSSKHLQSLL